MDYKFLSYPCAATLYGLMLHVTNNGKTEFAMSYPRIESKIGYSVKQIRNAIKLLKEYGVIQGQLKGQGKGHVSTFIIAYNIGTCNTKVSQKGSFKGSFEDTNKELILNQFETLWADYKHKGSKKVALERWMRLNDKERAEALVHAPIYRNTRPTQYCKALEVYINQKAWESAITTDYGLQLDPKKSRILTDKKMYAFYDYYNNKVQGTLLPSVEGDTENRRVLMNIVFSYFKWEKIAAVIDKAVQDPYNSGALPLTAGKHVQTFEEIMHPSNILKVNERAIRSATAG